MIDTNSYRCAIGWLGMCLPWIVVFQSLVYGYGWPDSISATYFVETCIVPFMIILGMSAILLFFYKGYDRVDNILNTCAAAFGLGICLFPCDALDGAKLAIGTWQLPYGISDILHTVCAIGFFIILAYNSYFQFTKGSDNPTPNKLKRNIIFRVCGIGMVASFLLLTLKLFDLNYVTWTVETIALSFFGISWLTKANKYSWLFADKN